LHMGVVGLQPLCIVRKDSSSGSDLRRASRTVRGLGGVELFHTRFTPLGLLDLETNKIASYCSAIDRSPHLKSNDTIFVSIAVVLLSQRGVEMESQRGV
jgi:hypothetical protein